MPSPRFQFSIRHDLPALSGIALGCIMVVLVLPFAIQLGDYLVEHHVNPWIWAIIGLFAGVWFMWKTAREER